MLWVPKLRRSVLLVLEIERNGYRVLFRYGHVFLVPRRTSFISTIVLGVREGKPMRFMANSNKVTMNRERVAPKVVQIHMEIDFRGSQQTQREFYFREIR